MSEEGAATVKLLFWERFQKSHFFAHAWRTESAQYIEAGDGGAEERAAIVEQAKKVWGAANPRHRWLLTQWFWHRARITPHTYGRDGTFVFSQILAYAALSEAEREERARSARRKVGIVMGLASSLAKAKMPPADEGSAKPATPPAAKANPPAVKAAKPPPSPKAATPPPVAKTNAPNTPRGKPMNRHNSNGRMPEVFSRRLIGEREAAKAEADAKAAHEEKLAQELVRRAEKGLPLEEANMKRVCLDVTPAFRKALRLEAAERGVTMTALILDALHAFGIRE